MNEIILLIILLILLIICASVTMNLHCKGIVNLYLSGAQMIVTFGSFVIATFIAGVLLLLVSAMDIQNIDFGIIEAICLGVAFIVIVMQSRKINYDISSTLIAIIGNVVWSIIGMLLIALIGLLLMMLTGGNNKSKKHKHCNFFDDLHKWGGL